MLQIQSSSEGAFFFLLLLFGAWAEARDDTADAKGGTDYIRNMVLNGEHETDNEVHSEQKKFSKKR